jgi:hypothetical protein
MHVAQPVRDPIIEEHKMEMMHDDVDEFPIAEDDKAEEREARELLESSQVLKDIYGKKIKLDTHWYFESPV